MRMRYIIYFLFVIGITFTFIGITTYIKQPASHIPSAENGIIDLSEMNDLNQSTFHLDGTWDFYWHAFTHTNDDIEKTSLQKTTITVPNSWETVKVNDENISNLGYGTYELTILIPEQYANETLGLYIPNVATAYKLWINDEFIISNGTIGTNKSEMVPVNYSRTVYFRPDQSTITLTMEVANFSQRKGGLWDSIQFGSADEITLLKVKNIGLQLLVVGSLIIMGIYNIFIYLLRKSIVYTLFLGLLCLIFAIRTLVLGETFLLNLFPNFPWEIQVKLEYLPTAFGLLLLVKYVKHRYKEDRFNYFDKAVLILSLVSGLIIIITPAIFYTKYLMAFLIVIPLTLIYFGYIFLQDFFKRNPASLFTLIGFTVFIVTMINDALFFLDFSNNGTYLSDGFFIFILSQTFAHAIHFSETHHQVENLSHELLEANRSLERKVEERTEQLSLVNAKLRKSENERKNLMSDLAHEISKPLTLIKGYSEAMVDEKLEPEKDFLQIIYNNALISERLIHDLSYLAKIETKLFRMVYQKVRLKTFPYKVYQHHRWTVENRGKYFEWIDKDNWAKDISDNTFIFVDPDRINQVFINIIDNALHHAENGNNIYMEVEFKLNADEQNEPNFEEMVADLTEDDSQTLNEEEIDGKKIGHCIFKIIDEGTGIKKEDFPYIFNRFYRGDRKEGGINSRGLGLAISKEIIEMHRGKIWVESEMEKGSTFFISLPVYE